MPESSAEGVFLDLDTLAPQDLDLSALWGTLSGWRTYASTEPGEVVDRCAGAWVAVSNKVVLDAERLAALPGLRLICVAATGANNVDLEAARRRGIVACNARGYATPSVAQHVFALLLALVTRLPEYTGAVADGAWGRSRTFCLLDYPVRELAGMTLGIVGYGELGHAVGGLARAFGMRVLLAQRPGGPPAAGRVPLAELLPQIDVLSLHCPLTPETRGLIGSSELALMRREAWLINTARGGIVDEAALAEVLRAGRLAGAGVDVLTEEPPVHGNPLLEAGVPNLLVTPHSAWASRESRQRLVGELVANIQAFRAGHPRNRVA